MKHPICSRGSENSNEDHSRVAAALTRWTSAVPTSAASSGVAAALTQRTPTSIPSVSSCKNWLRFFAVIPHPKLRAAIVRLLLLTLTFTFPFTASAQDQTITGNLTVTGQASVSTLIASGGTITGGASGLTINSGLTVTPAGNVGIGTTAPFAKLQVGSDAGFGTLHAGTNGAIAVTDATRALIEVQQSNVVRGFFQAVGGAVSAGAHTGHPFDLYGGGVFGLRIDTTGHVGIGTTAPAEFLEIKGDTSGKGIALYTPLTGDGGGSNIGWYSDTNGSKQTIAFMGAVNDGSNVRRGKLYFQTADDGDPTVRMTIDHSGNVGIGTVSPTAKLEVAGNTKVQGDLAVTGTFTAANFTGGPINAVGGDVGIGTTTPSRRLHVSVPDGEGSANMRIAGGSANIEYYRTNAGPIATMRAWQAGMAPVGNAATEDFIYSSFNGIDWFERMRITNAGNVGIGTVTPTAKLEVAGNAKVQGDLAVTGTFTAANFTGGPINAVAGNVGIGTTSFGTGEKLKVAATSEPTLYLAIDGSTSTDGGNVSLKLNKKAGASNASVDFWTDGLQKWAVGTGLTVTDDNLRFYDGAGHAVMTLERAGALDNTLYLKAGNVGIGTVSPTAKLEVAGDAKIQGNLSVTGTVVSNGTSGLTLNAGGTDQNVTISPSGTGQTVINSNVGINGSLRATGGMISSNSSAVGLEKNVLFNAITRYTVSQSGPAPVELPMLFDGYHGPTYSSVAPSAGSPQVITIEGLPGSHTQAGAWVGWSARYWGPRKFTIEGFDAYSGNSGSPAWRTIADYSTTPYSGDDFETRIPVSGEYTKLRLTVYEGSGTDGRFGLSELFLLEPEATRPYAGLLPSTMFEGVAGNVGIGTVSPTAKLEVFQAGADNTIAENIHLGSAHGTNRSTSITFGRSSVANEIGGNYNARIVGTANAPSDFGSTLQLQTHAVATGVWNTGLFMDNAGNVGLGTTSPGALLDVAGTSAKTVGDGSTQAKIGGALTVGGGTNYTASALTINTSFTDGGYNGQSYYGVNVAPTFDHGNGGGTGKQAAIYINPTFTGYDAPRYGIYSATTERSYFAGNVGIGTVSPTAKLDVNGTMRVAAAPFSAPTTGLGIEVDFRSDGNGYVTSIDRDNSSYKPLFVDGSSLVLNSFSPGNVGVGTANPTAKLHVVNGTIRADLGGSGASGIFTGNGSNLHIVHDGSGDVRLLNSAGGYKFANTSNTNDLVTINLGGNVGIGTSAPAEKLAVAGAVAATGGPQGNAALGPAAILGFASGQGFLQSVQWGSSFRQLSLQASNINFDIGDGSVATKVSINTAGNVGIGTTNPGLGGWTGRLLHVASPTSARLYLDGGDSSNAGLGLVSNGSVKWYLGSNGFSNGSLFTIGRAAAVETVVPYFAIDYSTGNVGIGTVSPTAKLEVVGDGKFTNGIAANTSGQPDGLTVGATSGGGSVKLKGNGDWAMSNTDSSFKVTGTSGTAFTLNSNKDATFAGSISTTNNLSLGGTLSVGGGSLRGGATGLTINAGAANQNLVLDSDGTGRIEVRDTLAVTNVNGTQYLLMGNQDLAGTNNPAILRSSNGNFYFGHGDSWAGQGGTFSSAVTFLSSGRVGIGTTTPRTPLDVAGQIRTAGGSLFLSPLGNDQWNGWNAAYKGEATPSIYVQTENASARVELNAAGSAEHRVVFSGTVRGGTLQAPTPTQNGHNLHLRMLGYDGVNYYPAAFIEMGAEGDQSTSNHRTSMRFATNSGTHMYITPEGNVGIGTDKTSGAKLAVEGVIHAREVLVDTVAWSDYVFADDYRNAPLSEVEAHIKTYKHLPGVPSAQEVAAKGVNLGEMQAVLLAKVEQLTLHLIEQEKRIQKLEMENAALRSNR